MFFLIFKRINDDDDDDGVDWTTLDICAVDFLKYPRCRRTKRRRAFSERNWMSKSLLRVSLACK